MKQIPPLLAILLLALLRTPPAYAQPVDIIRFEGSSAGWIYDTEQAAASTVIRSDETSGFVMLFCEATRLGFYIVLDETGLEEASAARDGLLQIHALARPGAPPLAQIPLRVFAPDAFRSAQWRPAELAPPERFLAALRDLTAGMRLKTWSLPQDGFAPSRTIDLLLPREATGSGLDMEIALALVQERCRRG